MVEASAGVLPDAALRAERQPSGGGFGRWIDRRFAIVALAPTTVVVFAILGIPLLVSLYLSFTGSSADQSLFAGRFIGAGNYEALVSDPEFVSSLLLTAAYTAIAVALEMAIGLGLALLLNLDLPLMGLFRTLLIVPMMMTPVVAGLCWKLLLDPSYGVVNALTGLHLIWLGEPRLAQLAVIVVNVWQNAPFVSILLLAGLRTMPPEPLEAAAIDGAGPLRVFWHVKLPLIAPYMLVALLLRAIFEFRAFDVIYVLTSGGPANSTMLLSLYTYFASFTQFDLSLGSAASWVMLIIGSAVCLALVATMRSRTVRAPIRIGGRRHGLGFLVAVYAALVVLTVVFLFPLLWIVGLSFKTRLQSFAMPPLFLWRPTLANYVTAFDTGHFLRTFGNSLIVSTGAVLLSVCIGVPAAYAFARFRFRGSTALFLSLLFTRMLPPIAVLVPMYVVFSRFGLINTRTSVVLAYMTFCLPLVVWIMRGYFESLPRDLEESAWIDGASRYAAFRLVALPLVRPGIVAVTILCLMLAWNDFLFAAVLTNNATRTLPVLIAGYTGGDMGTDWGPMTATAVLVVAPVILFSLAAQRHLVAGLSSGAVKG